MEFIFAFIQRALSGAQNGLGYAKEWQGALAVTVAMIALPLIFPSIGHGIWIFFAINLIANIMKMNGFMGFSDILKPYSDIHLWENIVTGGYFVYLALLGFNVLLLCCSVYPALILHKGFINLGSKLSFFAEKTDDKTGKTYGIPLLGIKIPRSGTKVRLILAGLSLIMVYITLKFDINVTVWLWKK